MYKYLTFFLFLSFGNLCGQFIEQFDIDHFDLVFPSDTALELSAEDMDINQDGVIIHQEVLNCQPKGRFVIFLPRNTYKEYRYYMESGRGKKALRKVVRAIEEGLSYRYKRPRLRQAGELERKITLFNLVKIYGNKIVNDPDLEKAERFWVDAIRHGTWIYLPTESQLFQPLFINLYPKGGFINTFQDIDKRLNENGIRYAIDPDYQFFVARLRFSSFSWLDYVLDSGIKCKKDTITTDNFFAEVELVHPFGNLLAGYYTMPMENITSIGGSIFLAWHSAGIGIESGGIWYYHTMRDLFVYNSWLANLNLYFFSSNRFFSPIFFITTGWKGNTLNENEFILTTGINQSYYSFSIGAQLQNIEILGQEEKLFHLETVPYCRIKLLTPSLYGMGFSIETEVKPSIPYYLLSFGIYWK